MYNIIYTGRILVFSEVAYHSNCLHGLAEAHFVSKNAADTCSGALDVSFYSRTYETHALKEAVNKNADDTVVIQPNKPVESLHKHGGKKRKKGEKKNIYIYIPLLYNRTIQLSPCTGDTD